MIKEVNNYVKYSSKDDIEILNLLRFKSFLSRLSSDD